MKTFYLLNKGSNGNLTLEEMLHAFYHNGYEHEEVTKIFSMIDLDGGGHVQYPEFIVTCLVFNDLLSFESCQRSFKTFPHIQGDNSIVEAQNI